MVQNMFKCNNMVFSENMKYIADYSIVRELGQGAFGRVLLGEKDNCQFAIKETISRTRGAMKAKVRTHVSSKVIIAKRYPHRCSQFFLCLLLL